MSFNERYPKILCIVQEDIKKINLFEGINVAKPLETKFLELLNAPSKHIRPLVSILYLKALGLDIDDKQIKYQTAIELVHNASLIHDDIIDESLLRRGIETLNSKFDNHLAVIAGDYLLAKALKNVIELGQVGLIEMFRKTLETMTQGEINQYFDRFRIPLLEDYLEKCEQKTAKLFEAAVKGASMLAQCFSIVEQAEVFAKNFGIAFQIRDDLINCQTTKSDVNEGVYTAPVIFSCAVEITDSGLEKTRDLLNNYLDTAKDSLKNLPENIYKQGLEELIEILRDK